MNFLDDVESNISLNEGVAPVKLSKYYKKSNPATNQPKEDKTTKDSPLEEQPSATGFLSVIQSQIGVNVNLFNNNQCLLGVSVKIMYEFDISSADHN